MKNGIGPQSLGASGMNPKSTPCGHPVTSPMKKLEDLSGDGKVTQKDVLIGRGVIDAEGDNPNNSGTPLYFQDDLAALQGAVSTLEKHNMTGGGGGTAAPIQPTAPAAPQSQPAAPEGGRAFGGVFGKIRQLRGAGRIT